MLFRQYRWKKLPFPPSVALVVTVWVGPVGDHGAAWLVAKRTASRQTHFLLGHLFRPQYGYAYLSSLLSLLRDPLRFYLLHLL